MIMRFITILLVEWVQIKNKADFRWAKGASEKEGDVWYDEATRVRDGPNAALFFYGGYLRRWARRPCMKGQARFWCSVRMPKEGERFGRTFGGSIAEGQRSALEGREMRSAGSGRQW
jgi:hypothetical protein